MKRGRRDHKRFNAKTLLSLFLMDGAKPASAVREALRGISWPTVKRAAKDIGVVREKKGYQCGSKWSLPTPVSPDVFMGEGI